MKTPTITITRAEYDQLNKAANAAVEHACELFRASRLVDELKARVAELENLYQKRGEAYEEERKEHEAALEVEEKRRWALEDVINELFERVEELEAARDAIDAAASVARGSGDYKGQIKYLAEAAKRFEL